MSTRQHRKISPWLVVSLILAWGVHAAFSQWSWTDVPPWDMPDDLYGHSLVKIDDEIYVFGGEDEEDGPKLNELWVYKNGKWQRVEPIGDQPPPRQGHAAVVVDGKMVIIGGEGSEGLLIDIWEFDPKTKKWTQLPSQGDLTPEARKWASTVVHNGTVYLYGGQDASGVNRMHSWKYDLTNNTWTPWTNDAPSAGQSMNLWQNGFYAYGGIRWSDTDFRDDLRYYNPNWPSDFQYVYTSGDAPSERAFHAAVTGGDKLYILEGKNSISNLMDAYKIERLQPADIHCTKLKGWPGVGLSLLKAVFLESDIQGYSGSIYHFGGKDQHGYAVNNFGRYNPDTDTYEDLRTVPSGRYGHSMVDVENVGPYLFGGADVSGVGLNDIWALNKDNSEWEKEVPIGYPPPPRQGHGAAYCDGKMYVFGGHKEGGDLNMLWVYEFSTTAWHPNTSMPPPGRSYHSMVTIGNQVWLFGGKKSDVNHKFGDLWCYEVQAYEWTQKASIPAGMARYGHCAFTANGKMYVYGGRGYDYFSDMWVYDPATDTWTEVNLLGEQPPPRKHQAIMFSEDMDPDIFAFAGGTGPASSSQKTNGAGLHTSNSDTVLSDTWEYNIGSNTWTRLADLPVGLTQAAAAVVDTLSNHVLLFGGMRGDSSVSGKMYMYLPEGTGVELVERTPTEFCLYQNYPNPFNAETVIQFTVKNPCDVSLKLYNLLGQEIKTLVDDFYTSGTHQVKLNSSDLASGIYLYRIQLGRFQATRKMVILE